MGLLRGRKDEGWRKYRMREKVFSVGDDVGEELRPHERPMGDCEHAHQAVGIFSSSSSLRRSCAPAGAWATPFV